MKVFFHHIMQNKCTFTLCKSDVQTGITGLANRCVVQPASWQKNPCWLIACLCERGFLRRHFYCGKNAYVIFGVCLRCYHNPSLFNSPCCLWRFDKTSVLEHFWGWFELLKRNHHPPSQVKNNSNHRNWTYILEFKLAAGTYNESWPNIHAQNIQPEWVKCWSFGAQIFLHDLLNVFFVCMYFLKVTVRCRTY